MMQPKRRRVGTGITERQEIDPNWLTAEGTLDQLEERAQWVLSTLPSSNWTEKWRNLAGSILRTRGLPSSFGHYHQDNDGHLIEDESLRTRVVAFTRFLLDPNGIEPPTNPYDEKYLPLTDIVEGKYGTDSVPHFMALILQQIWTLEISREVDDRPGAEVASFLIGQLVAQFTIKMKWERSALTGQKTNAHLAEARHRGAKVRHAKAKAWREPAREYAKVIWKERPKASISEVSRHIRRRFKEGNDPELPRNDRALQDAIRAFAPKKNGSDN